MDRDEISKRHRLLKDHLDEKQRRLLAAVDAEIIGRGGTAAVAGSTGMSRNTVRQGRRELQSLIQSPSPQVPARIRRPGGGRKSTIEKNPSFLHDLQSLLEPGTRGDPESPLRWTCKSVRILASELRRMGYKTNHQTVADVLKSMNYSLQSNRKTLEGASHPDRDAQFRHIHDTVKSFQHNSQPVISVDAKKKELIGSFKNNGREWHPRGCPEETQIYDFESLSAGRTCPYGVYDLTENMGWVSVGIDHDTSVFAVETIRRWWQTMGITLYPEATTLLITADGGGSNGSRVRLWKTELQKLSNETSLKITVSHFPPGTSKWNKIEHCLFSFISQNWRGKPLISIEVMLKLIAATKTNAGLRVLSNFDPSPYPKGIKVSDNEIAKVTLERDSFHGEWNYTIIPNSN